ncbi:MAG TPA: rhodanese-like domain-containing protein [Solirubrobacteraceae bacterium]|nr:rhodanese-like domain-containing protein [Solirubrobacteraceae bacterium]
MFGLRRIQTIAPHRASDRFFSGEISLVDVRTRAEYEQVRVPGALHIPLHEVRARMHEIRDDRPAAFVCRSGHRSAAAARRVARERPDVLNVAGGMGAWLAAGLPTARCPAPKRPR